MNKLSITIGHFYGTMMNTYGDDGNLITLKRRCEWRGIECTIKEIPLIYDIKPGEFDLYFFGGGQDQAQMMISKDLIGNHKDRQFMIDVEKGVPVLSICGGYQLLGEYYKPHEGPKLAGLSIFPAYTTASHDRMIGNIVVQPSDISYQTSDKARLNIAKPGTDWYLVGFENHSGKTYLKEGATPLGKVVTGFGNNGEDGTEGCIYKNAIGCYMHGSLLPKNPKLADWLIAKALEVKYGELIKLDPLDDTLETLAHDVMIHRLVK
jgi:lipid II isoglutaminyl synthase (glutamine-hydrolysing)